MPSDSSRNDQSSAPAAAGWGLALVEIAAIVGLFVILGGGPAPEVNEAHYLAKAKHYWNPEWLAGDIFLESADAHVVFYWTFGWLTLLFPLPIVAWIGRLVTWTLLAWSWRRLSWQLLPRPFWAVLTAALFAVGVENLHLAGEWLIGGVEAKGFAYVCLFLGLEALAKGNWNRTWLWLGVAAAFHVLVGGWAIVAVGLTWIVSPVERPSVKSMLPSLMLAFCISLIGLVPALWLSRGVDAETATIANTIYVDFRLPHHLVFHRFSRWFMVRHALLLLAFVAGVWSWQKRQPVDPAQRRLFAFVAGCIAIGIGGVLIDQLLLYFRPLANSLLRFYWLRLSDIMLPAGTALLIAMLADRLSASRPLLRQMTLLLLMAVAGFGVGTKYLEHQRDMRPGGDAQTLPTFPTDPERTEQIYHDWRSVTAWIKQNTPADAQFLTPRMQQTFKWYAHRKEVVSWKDVPQDAAGITAWWKRYREVHAYSLANGGLSARSDEELRELAQKYDANYIVIDRTYAHRPIGLPKVYPIAPEMNATYEVYRFPQVPVD